MIICCPSIKTRTNNNMLPTASEMFRTMFDCNNKGVFKLFKFIKRIEYFLKQKEEAKPKR